MKSRFLALILFALLPTTLLADFNFKEFFKEQLYALNSEMPIPLGSIGMITSAQMIGDTIEYRLEIDIYDRLGVENMELINFDQSNMKNMLSSAIQSNKATKSAIGLLGRNGLWIKYLIIVDENIRTVLFSPTDIMDVINTEPDYKKIVDDNIKQANINLPINMGMMIVEKYEIENNNLVVSVSVDETMTNIDTMIAGKDLIKTNTLEILKSGREPALINEFYNTAKAGYTMVYNYYGKTSKKACNVIFTPDEVLPVIPNTFIPDL